MSDPDLPDKPPAVSPPGESRPNTSPAPADFETQYRVYVPPRVPSLREAVAVGLILALALTLRILFTCQVEASGFHKLSELRAGTDSVSYDHIARWVLRNGWLEKSVDVSPLYPYVFLPLLYLVTGGNLFWTKILQGLLDTGTVFLVYVLARRLYNARAAVFAGLAAAVYAPFIVYQGQILGESLLNFLVAAFFVTLLGGERRMTLGRAAGAGALLALAAAAKPTAIVFAPLALLWIWSRTRSEGRSGWKRLAALAVGAAVFVAVLAPFAYRNYRASGEFVLVRGNSGVMLYMGNNPLATGAYFNPTGVDARALDAATRDMPLSLKDRAYRDAALAFVSNNPKQALALLWRKFTLFWGAPEIPNNLSVRLYRQTTFLRSWAFLSFACMLPLAVAGFVFSLGDRGVRLVAVQAVIYSLAIIAFIVVDRYRLALVPLLVPAAGYAASEIVLAFKSLNMGRTAAVGLIAAVVAVPVNWLDVKTTVNEWLHPDGLVDHVGNSVVIHDDGDYGTRFNSVLFNQDSAIVKYIIVRRPLTGLRGASVAVQMAVYAPGVLTVSLNDARIRMPMLQSPKRWAVFHFPPEAVAQGTNAVTISSDGLCRALVYADDVYSFSRSIYCPTKKEFITDSLDQVSYSFNPALHMGGHEFKVRLELEFEGAAVGVNRAPAPAPPRASPAESTS